MFEYLRKLLFKVSSVFLIVLSLMPSAFAQKKISVALLDLTVSNDLQQSISSVLSNIVRQEFLKSESYQILDRNNMATILKEQDFILSENCSGKECAVEVGKLLGVQKMIYGSIGTLGKKYIINLQMVDIETGKIEKIENENHVGAIEDLDASMVKISRRLIGDEKVVAAEQEYSLYVTSDPAGASVLLNDKPKGSTPLTLILDNDRKVKITLQASEYQDWFQEVKPKKGERVIVNAQLLKSKTSSNDLNQRYELYDYKKKSAGAAMAWSLIAGPYGGGHFYAGAPVRGGLILGTTLVVVFSSGERSGKQNAAIIPLAIIGAWIYDYIDSQKIVKSYNEKLKKELQIGLIPAINGQPARLAVSFSF